MTNIIHMKKFTLFCLGLFSLSFSAQPGSLDLSFDPSAGAGNNWVQAIAVQSDGKILLGGAFTTFASITQNRFVRLNSSGTVDNTFNIGTGPSSWVKTIIPLASNNIIIGGDFSSYDGTNRNYIAGVTSTGGLNSGFTPSTIPGSYVEASALQSDGKIVVGGIFSKGVTRLNSNGTVDTGFNNGTGADDWVRAVALQSDGKILIGGLFNTYSGVTRNRIARLNTDGTLDTSFDPLIGADGAVRDICIQSDGKIIVVGEFNNFNGNASNRIVRLNTNGTVDNSFNVGTGASSNILSCALQADSKIIVGGNFTSYNGNASSRLARINADGTFDNTFNVGSGANGTIRKVHLQSNGAILIGGDFTSYNGTTRNRVARILGGNATSLNQNIATEQLNFTLQPNPFQTELRIRNNTSELDLYDLTIQSITGKKVLKLSASELKENNAFVTIKTDKLDSGIYTLILNTSKGTIARKIVKE